MVWPVRIKDLYRNCEHIHPLQQEWVGVLVRQLKQHKEVEEVFVFGSSVTKWCRNKSDVDIYVKLEKEMRRKELIDYREIHFPMDLITNFEATKEFVEQIRKEGVLVYDKGDAA